MSGAVSVNGRCLNGTFQYVHWIGGTLMVAIRCQEAVQSFPLRYVTAVDAWWPTVIKMMSTDKFNEIVRVLEDTGSLRIYLTVTQQIRIVRLSEGYRRDDTCAVLPAAADMVRAILADYPKWLSYESD